MCYSGEVGENLRQELWDKSLYFRKGCIDRGYDGMHVHEEGPIIPFITGNIPECKTIYNSFIEKQIFPSAFMYPLGMVLFKKKNKNKKRIKKKILKGWCHAKRSSPVLSCTR